MTKLFADDPPPGVARAFRALLAGDRAAGGHAEFAALYGPLVEESYIIGQAGQSLDGFIATRSGDSHYVTGRESLVHLHRLRALADAVVVGAATVLSDDPRLTVRLCEGRDPLRVVVDPRATIGPEARAFASPGDALRLVAKGGATRSFDVEVPRDDRGLAAEAIVELLRERGARRVLVEGGGRLVSSFLQAGALHRLHVVVAPFLMGDGVRGPRPEAIEPLSSAVRPASRSWVLGPDVLFDLDLAQTGEPGDGRRLS